MTTLKFIFNIKNSEFFLSLPSFILKNCFFCLNMPNIYLHFVCSVVQFQLKQFHNNLAKKKYICGERGWFSIKPVEKWRTPHIKSYSFEFCSFWFSLTKMTLIRIWYSRNECRVWRNHQSCLKLKQFEKSSCTFVWERR